MKSFLVFVSVCVGFAFFYLVTTISGEDEEFLQMYTFIARLSSMAAMCKRIMHIAHYALRCYLWHIQDFRCVSIKVPTEISILCVHSARAV